MSNIKIIKTIVFILTFLLMFGLLCFITLIVKKTGVNPEAMVDSTIGEPFGTNIKDIDINDNLLYITLINGGLSDRIVILDPKTGKIISKINLN